MKTIGILAFRKPAFDSYASIDQIVEAGEKKGFNMVRLYQEYLTFRKNGHSIEVLHDGHPLGQIDAIIARPNITEEPTLNTYTPELLAEAGYLIVNNLSNLSRTKNKLDQHATFYKHDIPTPKWGIARTADGAIKLAEQIGWPIIIKTSFGTHGKGVFYAENSETLQPIVDYIHIRDHAPVIIEEFVQEANRQDYRAYVVGGQVIAAMERHARPGDIRANASLGGQATKAELTEDEINLSIKVAEIFKLDIAGVDFVRTSQGPQVLEVNANPGFQELQKVTEIDIAGALIDFAASKIK
ncbi:RimK family alpha-L-glutamate ligase [Patescibacteria group bacterium]|nr:RimK family alpha-L-glutamate ligase [Patescibacteria group bacterium]MBU1705673.1 RimK family alpha-L-glutamate ligase [Patescibacteria group bacterium]